jgi:hypothetical protein
MYLGEVQPSGRHALGCTIGQTPSPIGLIATHRTRGSGCDVSEWLTRSVLFRNDWFSAKWPGNRQFRIVP